MKSFVYLALLGAILAETEVAPSDDTPSASKAAADAKVKAADARKAWNDSENEYEAQYKVMAKIVSDREEFKKPADEALDLFTKAKKVATDYIEANKDNGKDKESLEGALGKAKKEKE